MDLGATPSGALNVLLVEDEIMIAMLMEDVLADMGHVVVGVACGVEAALEMAETVEADLAILDVNIDGRPSFPVADVLRRRGVPVLFATGYGAAGLDGDYRDAVFINKPFDSRELVGAISLIGAAA